MKNFILDAQPKFNEAKVTIEQTTYQLKRVAGNGCYLNVWENGMPRDRLTLTTQDMKALYYLLIVKDCK